MIPAKVLPSPNVIECILEAWCMDSGTNAALQRIDDSAERWQTYVDAVEWLSARLEQAEAVERACANDE